jgi:hypothetical protein
MAGVGSNDADNEEEIEEAATTPKPTSKGKKQTTLSKFAKRKVDQQDVEDEVEVLPMRKKLKQASTKSAYKQPSAEEVQDKEAGV